MSEQDPQPQAPGTVVDGHFDEANFFADPRKVKRVPIPEIRGWVDVREEITIKEERALYAKAFKGQVTIPPPAGSPADVKPEVRNEYDMEQVNFGTTLLYLADWSLKKKLNASSLMSLKPKIYRAIDAAVQNYLTSVAEGKDESPSASGGAPTSTSAA